MVHTVKNEEDLVKLTFDFLYTWLMVDCEAKLHLQSQIWNPYWRSLHLTTLNGTTAKKTIIGRDKGSNHVLKICFYFLMMMHLWRHLDVESVFLIVEFFFVFANVHVWLTTNEKFKWCVIVNNKYFMFVLKLCFDVAESVDTAKHPFLR